MGMRENKDGAVTVAIMWKQAPGRGHIKVRNGALKNVVLAGQTSGEVDKDFSFSCDSPCRLETTIENANLSPGANPTSASILTAENPFSFFLRDVKAAWPIFIPAYGVVVTTADDRRSYEQIAADVTGRGLRTGIRQIESEPEETYEQAAECVRQMQSCPTLLGIGRDARVFLVALREGSEWHDWVEPWAGRRPLKLPELGDTPVKYRFHLGRGVGAVHAVSRRLEDGVLPILLGRVEDGDVVYDTTTFVTLDSQELTAENIEGSDFLIGTSMLENEKLENQREEAFKKEQSRQEQTLLCCRVDAVNTGSVPRYAFFHGAVPGPNTTWDAPTGFAQLTSGQVCCVTRLNGEPCPQKEMSVLVGPGEKAIFEFYIPHRPVAPARAEAIAKLDFDRLLSQCRAYWRKKLESAAKIRLPEQRISEMVQAGLLHLDLHIYGQQPDGTLSPQIGPLYCPIGTESSPIIQFLDSMGYADVAGRSLQFFLDLQHEDGMIQNFQRYTVETGAALWAMGEHYRYTRD
ncbi:MAG: hypothetical protein KAU28_10415, partial [Phycisphaerae bacterium]|nr:hypothetical protein [Phycisphaerae bacterium]